MLDSVTPRAVPTTVVEAAVEAATEAVDQVLASVTRSVSTWVSAEELARAALAAAVPLVLSEAARRLEALAPELMAAAHQCSVDDLTPDDEVEIVSLRLLILHAFAGLRTEWESS